MTSAKVFYRSINDKKTKCEKKNYRAVACPVQPRSYRSESAFPSQVQEAQNRLKIESDQLTGFNEAELRWGAIAAGPRVTNVNKTSERKSLLCLLFTLCCLFFNIT